MSNFWEAFFLLLIWVPLVMLWMGALFDLFRRDDIGGVSKCLWLACILLIPWLGVLFYLVARPRGATPEERAVMTGTAAGAAPPQPPPATVN